MYFKLFWKIRLKSDEKYTRKWYDLIKIVDNKWLIKFSLENADASVKSSVHRNHDGKGHMSVQMQTEPHNLTKMFIEAAQKEGHPFNGKYIRILNREKWRENEKNTEDYNAETQEGVSFIQLTQQFGRRYEWMSWIFSRYHIFPS